MRQAKAKLEPARIGFGTGFSYLNVNRDVIDPGTRLWTQGPNLNGPSDKTVAAIRFETPEGQPPILKGAELVRTEGGRHEYVFNAANVNIADLLEQAGAQTEVLDVETHRAPIDDVIADIYVKWQGRAEEEPGTREAPV